MDTHQPIVSYAPNVKSLGMAIAVGLAWPTGTKIVYLKTNSDLIVVLPQSYAPNPPQVMWRVEIRTTGKDLHDQAVADVNTALAMLAQVDVPTRHPAGPGLHQRAVVPRRRARHLPRPMRGSLWPRPRLHAGGRGRQAEG